MVSMSPLKSSLATMFLGKTMGEALAAAEQKHPRKRFYFIRVGYPTTPYCLLQEPHLAMKLEGAFDSQLAPRLRVTTPRRVVLDLGLLCV